MRSLIAVVVLLALAGCERAKVFKLCRAEREALLPMLPAIGETVGEETLNYGYVSYPVLEVRTECMKVGYRALVVLGVMKQDPEAATYRQVRSIADAERWVRTLIAKGHNPRLLDRRLLVLVLAQDPEISVTGFKTYFQVALSLYSTLSDSVVYGVRNDRESLPLGEHWSWDGGDDYWLR